MAKDKTITKTSEASRTLDDLEEGVRGNSEDKFREAAARNSAEAVTNLVENKAERDTLAKVVTKKQVQQIVGKKVSKKDVKKIKEDIKNPTEIARTFEQVAKDKTPKSPVDAFKQALVAFMPQIGGAVVGGILEGTEGAIAGSEEGAKMGKQLDALKAQDQAAIKAGVDRDFKEAEFAQKEGMQEKAIQANKDIAQMNIASREKLAEQKNLADLAAQYGKANPSGRQKLDKLAGEDKKRVGSIMTADRSITDMVVAIENGENLFEVLGESKYTDARNRFVEAIARLQSGAAISDKEFDIYTGLTPASVEAKAVIEEKMKRNRQFIDDRLHLYGLSRQDLNLPSPISLKDKSELMSRREELLAKKRGL